MIDAKKSAAIGQLCPECGHRTGAVIVLARNFTHRTYYGRCRQYPACKTTYDVVVNNKVKQHGR